MLCSAAVTDLFADDSHVAAGFTDGSMAVYQISSGKLRFLNIICFRPF